MTIPPKRPLPRQYMRGLDFPPSNHRTAAVHKTVAVLRYRVRPEKGMHMKQDEARRKNMRREDAGQQKVSKEHGHGRQQEFTHRRDCMKPANCGADMNPALDAIDDLLIEMAKMMDKEFMETGKDLAELYRAVCTAAAKLPEMELNTELMTVVNDENGLAVFFNRVNAVHGDGAVKHPDGDDTDSADDDDEEGMIYDEY